MNMTELAQVAGVSVSTISKAFSGSKEISKEKRQEIFEIAKENGCFDKYYKNSYMGTIVAVICPEYKSGLYSQWLAILEEKIKEKSAIMVVASNDFDEERTKELVKYFSEYSGVDGIILLTGLSGVKECSVPLVTMGENEFFDSVRVSEEAAVADAIKHLKEKGHKKIAFIGEPHTKKRRESFENAMKKNLIPVKEEYILEDDSRFEEAGYNAMNRLLALKNRPTAVIAAYDNIAVGAAKSISEHGLKVPDDISIVGSDDNAELQYLDVPITSITAYNDDLCDILVELLFERMKNPKERKHIKILRELVIRESVGEAPSK